ncbi:MAG: hypothetical protein QM662_02885 [Gordonia sp. (in: high G+C Gram-positive bacteria)]
MPPGFTYGVVVPAKEKVARLKDDDDPDWDWGSPPPRGHVGKLPSTWLDDWRRWPPTVTRGHKQQKHTCLDELHSRYGSVCAYLGVYVERGTVDHFEPKSTALVRTTYRWENFRLASSKANTNKREYRDVLDPFDIPERLFKLKLVNCTVQVDTAIAAPGEKLHADAVATIRRLDLNSRVFIGLRQKYLTDYLHSTDGRSAARARLRVNSPFIHDEVVRQNW